MNCYCKKACFITAILLLLSMDDVSYAENQTGMKYLRLGVGTGFLNFQTNKYINFINTSVKTGLMFDMSSGYYLNDRSQIALLFGFHRKRDDISYIHSYEFLANYRYDFSPYRDFSPYAQIGFGVILNSLSEPVSSSMNFISPVATLGFGISYNLSQGLFIDTGCTMQFYSFADKSVLDNNNKNNIKSSLLLHAVTFGAGFRF